MDLQQDGNDATFRNDIPLSKSLGTRIILFIAGTIAITSLVLGYIYSEGSNKIILEKHNHIRLLEEKLQSYELFDSWNSARRDLRVILHSPSFTSLLTELNNDTESPQLSELKERLARKFISFMQASPDYMQVRLIGIANGGYEIVRVNRDANGIVVVSEKELQNKSSRDYYKDILKLSKGDYYYSSIDLNREYGKIEKPYKPTVRVAVPVFTDMEKLFATLIINIDLTHAFSAIKNMVDKNTTLYLINEQGDYLVHPNKQKEFAFDFNKQERLVYDYPSLANVLRNLDRNGVSKEITLNGKTQFLNMVYLTPDQKYSNNIIAIQMVPKGELFEELSKSQTTGHIFAILFTLSSIFIAIIFIRGLLLSIKHLTDSAVRAANGNYTKTRFPKGKDEIGLLSITFNEMVKRIRHREKLLTDKQKRYMAIFNGASDAVVVVDKDGNIEEANKSFYDIVGLHYRDANSVNLLDYIKEARSNIDCLETECCMCELSDLCHGEITIISTDEDEIPVAAALTGFETSNGSRFATYIHDLRDQKSAESERINLLLQLKQAQKMESIGLLASGIAHDFNNVLSCISGYSDLLKTLDDVDKSTQEQYLDQIISASDNAKQMIRQMMSFCHSHDSQNSTNDPTTTIMNIISVLEHGLTSRIILTHDIRITNNSLPIAPFQLQQIILNLCTNARDAMEGDGRIHIAAAEVFLGQDQCTSCGEEFDGIYMELVVTDEGEGIEQDKLVKLFEPLFTTKAKDQGTGLGLFMVHNIMHEIGGHIIVDTTKGLGTSFRLYIPVGNMNDESGNPAPLIRQMKEA
ncbi:MAG: PAS domain S-box protein [Gammaproteobacteria bacterium]|nr:PAS domain S-box protein [Gammaproteobacteria bacterium]